MVMIPTYRCLLSAATFEFSWIILPPLLPIDGIRLTSLASGSPDAQHDRAEGRLVPSTTTWVQSRPSLFVITSWEIHAGLKTAFRGLSDLNEFLSLEPRLWIPCQFHLSRDESGITIWSAISWKESNCHWMINRGAENKTKNVSKKSVTKHFYDCFDCF